MASEYYSSYKGVFELTQLQTYSDGCKIGLNTALLLP